MSLVENKETTVVDDVLIWVWIAQGDKKQYKLSLHGPLGNEANRLVFCAAGCCCRNCEWEARVMVWKPPRISPYSRPYKWEATRRGRGWAHDLRNDQPNWDFAVLGLQVGSYWRVRVEQKWANRLSNNSLDRWLEDETEDSVLPLLRIPKGIIRIIAGYALPLLFMTSKGVYRYYDWDASKLVDISKGWASVTPSDYYKRLLRNPLKTDVSV